jgi:hypothetical protein
MGKIKITLNKSELEHLYYNQHKTDQQIASLLNVGWKSVFNARKRLEIKSNRSTISKDDLVRLYCKELKTDEEIAKIYNITLGRVFITRKKYGIAAINRFERHVCQPTERQIEIIYGTMLGDGSITNEKCSVNKSLRLLHGLKQKKYLFWKFNELKSLCIKNPIKTKNGRWSFSTFYHPFFTNLRNEFYLSNVKIITEKILNKLTPLSVAVWFMDDGCNCNEGLSLRICTCCFSESEHALIKKWFYGKFEIDTRIAVYNGYRYIIVSNHCRQKFINLIKHDIAEPMTYKVFSRRLDNVYS